MEISFSSNSVTDDYIATKFGTCHDSPAVVSCAKYCSDHFFSIWMRAKWNFHHIWIVMEKLLVKWAPGQGSHIGKEALECYFRYYPYHIFSCFSAKITMVPWWSEDWGWGGVGWLWGCPFVGMATGPNIVVGSGLKRDRQWTEKWHTQGWKVAHGPKCNIWVLE